MSREASASAAGACLVGIGVCAKQVPALGALFESLPPTCDLAFVVLMSAAAEAEKGRAVLRSADIGMPVEEVTKSVRIEAGHVYLVPSGATVTTTTTHLVLESSTSDSTRLDQFLISLARSHSDRAIGALLSENVNEGALGLREVRARGGLTIVQEPAAAECDDMARAASAPEDVDLVLPVAQLGSAALRFAQTAPQLPLSEGTQRATVDNAPPEARIRFYQLLEHLQGHSQLDVMLYDPELLVHRVYRRMRCHGIEQPLQYLEMLSANDRETAALESELSITPCRFLFDEEVFEVLAKQIVPQLFEDAEDKELRVWLVDCGTGEEAYSVAILMLEEAERRGLRTPIRVFASDVDPGRLQRAKQGLYPRGIELQVDAGRLRRFFEREDAGYRIRQEVRDLVLFAEHDLLSRAPFMRLDLALSRHLLGRLHHDARNQALEVLCYALRPGCFLVARNADVLDRTDLFTPNEHGIAIRRHHIGTELRLPFLDSMQDHNSSAPRPAPHYADLHLKMAQPCMPASLLVSPDDEIVHLSERAGRYLVYHGGSPDHQLKNKIHPELWPALQVGLLQARQQKLPYSTRVIRVRLGDSLVQVRQEIRPAQEPEAEGFALVLFEDLAERSQPPSRASEPARELEAPGIINDYEVKCQQLKSSNEELTTANEELRTALEELQASKEELHSVNEELHTVNRQNLSDVREYAQLSETFQNLILSADISTLFLNRELDIIWFTPSIRKIFRIDSDDRGRPISDIAHELDYGNLLQDAEQVLTTLRPVEREVSTREGNWYISQILPYRGATDRIEGVVLTFVDLSERKRAQLALRESEERYRELFETMDDGFCVAELLMDEAGEAVDYRFVEANHAFEQHVDAQNIVGKSARELSVDDELCWIDICSHVALTGVAERFHRHVERLNRDFDVYAFPAGDANQRRIAMLLKDMSKHRHLVEQLNRAAQELAKTNERKDEYLAMLGHELRNPLAAIRSAAEVIKLSGGLDGRLASVFNVLERQTTHMSRLVDGLLDASRIARGKVKLELEALDLAEILQAVATDRTAEAQTHGLSLTTDLEPETWIRGDSVRLVQVFDNLVGNAIKFRNGPGTVHISLKRHDGQAVVGVRDTGIGMRPEVLEHVFHSFHQEAQDTSRSAGGLGLGLALAKGLVELHHGSIEARSEGLGKGSEFIVRLPLVVKPEQRAQDVAEAEPAPLSATQALGQSPDVGQSESEAG